MKSKPRFGTLKAAFNMENKTEAVTVLKHLRMLAPLLTFELIAESVEVTDAPSN